MECKEGRGWASPRSLAGLTGNMEHGALDPSGGGMGGAGGDDDED